MLVFVKIKVAVPALHPVTTPALVTVATDGLVLDQVPPVAGVRFVVVPGQILVAPETLTIGFGLTLMTTDGTAVHPKSLVTVTRYVLEGSVGITVTAFTIAFPAFALH